MTPVTINVITISKVDFTIDRVRRSTRSTLRRAHKRMADNAVNRKRKRNLPHKKSTQLDAFVGELERTTSELEKLEKQIFDLEASYFAHSGPEGNIVAGWGSAKNFVDYSKRYSKILQHTKNEVEIEKQRVFSLSSKSSPAYHTDRPGHQTISK